MEIEKFYEDKNDIYYSHPRPELIKYVPSDAKLVLDVGCGSGNFGKLLKEQRGCKVFGLEPNLNSVKEAENKLDKIYHGIFDNAFVQGIDQKFDCIFFNDVLEHLSDPDGALLLAQQLLRSEGYVIASIPNIRSYPVILGLLRYKDFQYTNAGVLDKTHLKFFTEKSMVRLFETTGYEVECIEGINQQSYKYLNLINILTFNSFIDMSYPQFAIKARIKGAAMNESL